MGRFGLSGLAFLALASCASGNTAKTDRDGYTVVEASDELDADGAPISFAIEEGDELQRLPDAALPRPSCGMVLWTLQNEQPTPVFRYVVGEGAEIVMKKSRIELVRADFAGASEFGVFETQDFSGAGGVSVSVSTSFGAGFAGGAYLERSVVKVESGDGWGIVTPAAGIAGCRN